MDISKLLALKCVKKVRKLSLYASQIKKSPNWRFFGKMKIYEIEFYAKNQFG